VAQEEHLINYTRLCGLSRRLQLFPGVTGIIMEITATTYCEYPYFHLFPMLRDIRVDATEPPFPFLAATMDGYPDLRRLHFYTDNENIACPVSILLNFTHLQHIQLSVSDCRIDDPAMLHLMSLESLHFFDIGCGESWSFRVTSLRNGCKHLHTLDLRSDTQNIAHLLRQLTIPKSAANISLTMGQYFLMEEEWDAYSSECVDTVARKFGAGLKSLTLDVTDILDMPRDHPISFRCLHKFQGLKHLENLEMGAGQLTLSDDDVVALATTFPTLQVLRCYTSNESILPGPTIKILQIIAQICPALRELELPLTGDTRNISINNLPHQFHGLQELSIGQLQVSEPLAMAEYLYYLFPRLRVLESRHYEFCGSEVNWHNGDCEEGEHDNLRIAMEALRMLGRAELRRHHRERIGQ
jgi:hypothetical protein